MAETPSPGAGQGGEVHRSSALEGSFLAQHRYPPEAHAPAASPPGPPPSPPRRGVGVRVVLPVCLFAVLVGGVAWVSQYRPGRKQADRVAPAPMNVPFRLTLIRTAEEDPSTGYVREFERGVEGHIDYLFENSSAADAELGVQWKQCTCSRLEVCPLTEAEARPLLDLDRQAGDDKLSGAARMGKMAEGRVALERLAGRLGDRWKPINPDDGRGVRVPRGGCVVVRLIWRARDDERFKLKADLWMVPAGAATAPDDRPVMPVEPTIELVPPARLFPERQSVGRLYAHGSVSRSFLIWTSTRGGLEVKLTGEADPCLVCAASPLTPAEFPAVEKKLLAGGINTRMRAAWRVRATVYEERGGKQLDMGAFLRTVPVKVTSDGRPLDVPAPILYGRVQSEIRVVGADETEQINLGSFKARDGTGQTVRLVAPSDVKLELDAGQPPFLELKLAKGETQGKETTWDLDVSVAPNGFRGTLPGDTAVVVRTTGRGAQPRRVRIHVVGTAARD